MITTRIPVFLIVLTVFILSDSRTAYSDHLCDKVCDEDDPSKCWLACPVTCDGNCSVDIKVNGSNNPASIPWGTSADLSWISSNVSFCTASGDWSGSKPVTGSGATVTLNEVRTYNYFLACTDDSASDIVQVTVNPPIPSVPNASVSKPDYCVTGPSATVNWAYFDPSGSP